MCFFEGAALPIPPWKKGCKVFQADIKCHSYEISEAATFVKSCELAPIYNECIAKDEAKFKCIETCPDMDCRELDSGSHLTISLFGLLLIFYSSFI